MDFAVSAEHKVPLKESEKRDKYPDLARELKKQWNMKVTMIQIAIDALGKVTKVLLQGLGGNKKSSRDHPNYGIVDIGQNTEDSPRD